MKKIINAAIEKEIALDKINKSIKNLILSASGWRKVFAENEDEESRTENISDEDKIIIAVMAHTFGYYLKNIIKDKISCIAVSRDTRPTGAVISDIIIKVLSNAGFSVAYPGISSAPEIMAYAKENSRIDAFVYISASHNPIGHNGIKFGLDNGGVLDGQEVAKLIKAFKENVSDINLLNELKKTVNNSDIRCIYKQTAKNKKESFKSYFDFSKKVIAYMEDSSASDSFFNELKQSLVETKLGIIAELNGSARTLSIDKKLLKDCGLKVKTINAKPGQIRHRIVPEGESLNQCRDELEKARKKDLSFILGYVPDCDGDRGNIVYFNENTNKAEILEAQEVFALSCMAELAYLDYTGITDKTAVSVNGPTSMRIEEICSYFNTECHRAEVGEANVVNLARKLRADSLNVRILGEGSNGGNISHPAAVRDPINTIFSIIKLLSIKSTDNKKGLFEIWCSRSKQMNLYKKDFSLTDIINSLPKYITTSAFEEQAVMKIKTMDHAVLKKKYEKIFLKSWEEKKNELSEKYNINSYEEHNYEGMEDKTGFGPEFRSGQEKGGLKIIFKDKNKKNISYIWMRGSGTEPVFRILADIKGSNKSFEKYLLDWQRELVKKADSE